MILLVVKARYRTFERRGRQTSADRLFCAARPLGGLMKNAFYAQSGGVTAVINASACGLIETARRHRDKIAKVYAGRHGIIGALTEDMIDHQQGECGPPSAAFATHLGVRSVSARYKTGGDRQESSSVRTPH